MASAWCDGVVLWNGVDVVVVRETNLLRSLPDGVERGWPELADGRATACGLVVERWRDLGLQS